MKKCQIFCFFLFAWSLIACSKASQPPIPPPCATPEASSASGNATPIPLTPASQASRAGIRPVKTEMRNVLFHLTDKASAHLETLSGELWPTGKNEIPVFDDKTSFEVRVSSGKVSLTPDALAVIMNNHVFARKDAPLKDLSISIDHGRLIIKGKLHSKGDIPFGTAGTLSTTSDGRLRVHTQKVTALRLPVTGMMGLFGIELANLINTSKIDGLETDKNDLLVDLGKLLPPPHIRGKVTSVMLEPNAIVTIFGDGGALSPASEEGGNYMLFRGNTIRFGRLTMENTDLTLLDLDPADPLDWNLDHYKDQLMAGYSKIDSKFGLRAYVKDFAKLGRFPAAQQSTVPIN
jgi:hypothetical protein